MAQRSWTDQQLRDAVAASTTYRGVLRALGLKNGSLVYVQRCIIEAGLSTAHFAFAPRLQNKLCSDERLRELVPRCTSATEVLNELGIELSGHNFFKLRRRATALGISTDHFKRQRKPYNNTWRRWTDEQLRAAVQASSNYAQVIRSLGLIPAGGNYDQVQRRVRELAIDTTHFDARAWNKDGRATTLPIPLDVVLVAGRPTSSHGLKLRLFAAGLKKQACELCGWAERSADGRIPLELDHINGDKNDNRLDNLRILCPNCHSLQPTHRGLNQRRRNRHNSAGMAQ
jgi:5-methylcytosine-specific restriction endonuclease McrA